MSVQAQGGEEAVPRLGRAGRLVAVAVVAALLGGIALAARQVVLIRDIERLRPHELVLWDLAQLQRQLLVLQGGVLATPGAHSPESLQLLLDLAFSRMAVLEQGDAANLVRSLGTAREALPEIRARLEAVEAEFPALLATPGVVPPRLREHLTAAVRLSQTLHVRVFNDDIARAARLGEGLKQVVPLVMGSAALFVALVVVLIALIWRTWHLRMQEVLALLADLREAKAAADQASLAKTRFLGSMSHELRTPLSAVLGNTQLLLRGVYGPVEPKVRAALEAVEANGRQLLELIDDVLELSRIEAGRLELEVQPQDPLAVLEAARTRLQGLAEVKGLALAVDNGPGVPRSATFDAMRVEQVLTNLVGNAIKFTDSGGVRLSVRGDAHETVFVVADTGIGLDAAEQADLFEEFRQRDTAIARPKVGAGLGLAIARRLVEAHGGRIWVESEPGAGATFYFSIPQREGS